MASFFQHRDEGRNETVVLHKSAMTFDWPSVEEAHPNRVWMGNAGSPRRVKNAQPNRVWMGDGLGWGWMGLSAGSDDDAAPATLSRLWLFRCDGGQPVRRKHMAASCRTLIGPSGRAARQQTRERIHSTPTSHAADCPVIGRGTVPPQCCGTHRSCNRGNAAST